MREHQRRLSVFESVPGTGSIVSTVHVQHIPAVGYFTLN